ncbi:unnamed protein product [Ectocarpus sp. 8 AP-2014]
MGSIAHAGVPLPRPVSPNEVLVSVRTSPRGPGLCRIYRRGRIPASRKNRSPLVSSKRRESVDKTSTLGSTDQARGRGLPTTTPRNGNACTSLAARTLTPTQRQQMRQFLLMWRGKEFTRNGEVFAFALSEPQIQRVLEIVPTSVDDLRKITGWEDGGKLANCLAAIHRFPEHNNSSPEWQ